MYVLVLCCCVTDYCKTQPLRTTSTHYLLVSGSGIREWVGWLTLSQGLSLWACGPAVTGLQSSEGLPTTGRSAYEITHMAVGGPWPVLRFVWRLQLFTYMNLSSGLPERPPDTGSCLLPALRASVWVGSVSLLHLQRWRAVDSAIFCGSHRPTLVRYNMREDCTISGDGSLGKPIGGGLPQIIFFQPWKSRSMREKSLTSMWLFWLTI